MSCPDWRRLDPAARDSASPAAPASHRWQAALRHFDGGCTLCRREALAADPTLMFRSLPDPAANMTAAAEAEEVAAARRAVAAMRAASRAGNHGHESDSTPLLDRLPLTQRAPRAPRAPRVGHPRHAMRYLLAAGLAGLALFAGAGQTWHAGSVGGSHAAALLAPPSAIRPADGEAPGVVPAATRSSIEGLTRPEARVYQIDGPQMSVVMIVDAKLDV